MIGAAPCEVGIQHDCSTSLCNTSSTYANFAVMLEKGSQGAVLDCAVAEVCGHCDTTPAVMGARKRSSASRGCYPLTHEVHPHFAVCVYPHAEPMMRRRRSSVVVRCLLSVVEVRNAAPRGLMWYRGKLGLKEQTHPLRMGDTREPCIPCA